MSGQRWDVARQLLPGGPDPCVGRSDWRLPHRYSQTEVSGVCTTSLNPPQSLPSSWCKPLCKKWALSDSGGGGTELSLLCFRLRRDSSGIFDYQESWDHSPDGKNGLDDSFENGHQFKRMLSPPQPPLFCDQPDLTSLIDTNFSEQVKVAESETRLRAVGSRQKETGYDFSSLVGKVYEEHGTSNCMNFTGLSAPHGQAGFCAGSSSPRSLGCGTKEGGCSSRRRSLGDESFTGFDKSAPLPSWGGDLESSVWSLDLQGNLIVAGRSNGKLEVRSEGLPAQALGELPAAR